MPAMPPGGARPPRQPVVASAASGTWVQALGTLLMVLAVAGLLQRLASVAERSVQQAQARQAAQALQAEAQWRCRALRPAAARLRCLALLREHPLADAAALQALLAAAAL